MAITRPTLESIIARVQADIAAETEGSPYIFSSFERVLAYTLAGLAHGLYGNIEYNRKQILPTTCELDILLGWGTVLALPRKSATISSGTITFTGTNTTVVPEGTQLLSPDGIVTYITTEEGTISGGSVTVDAESEVTGVDTALDAGATLTLVTPIAGISSTVTVVAMDGGTDTEDTEDYRARILQGARNPTGGGTPGDYERWALEVEGVTRAWEFGNRMGYGTVSLGFVRDDDVSIIPSAGEVEDVQEYIDSKKPIDVAAVYVVAPIAKPVTMTINLVPNTADVRAAVTAELTVLFSNTNLEEALPLSQIDAAISSASGEVSHTITTISSLVPGDWEILTLGVVTWA